MDEPKRRYIEAKRMGYEEGLRETEDQMAELTDERDETARESREFHDQCAIAAMQALCMYPRFNAASEEIIARTSQDMANRMVIERNDRMVIERNKRWTSCGTSSHSH